MSSQESEKVRKPRVENKGPGDVRFKGRVKNTHICKTYERRAMMKQDEIKIGGNLFLIEAHEEEISEDEETLDEETFG